MDFAPIASSDRQAVQAISLHSAIRSCNFTFANLYGWQFLYQTQFAIEGNAVVLRFVFDNDLTHAICTAEPLRHTLLDPLFDKGKLTLLIPDDAMTEQVCNLYPGQTTVTPLRDNQDYIYLRTELSQMKGKSLKNKRNHVNKFKADHPDFEYRPLQPDLFDQCLHLEAAWREQTEAGDPSEVDSHATEQKVMQRVFDHWNELDMTGGALFTEGRLVAFTYGAPITTDTFDVCVEKADRSVDGAYSIINQQFAEHLPEHYLYINREEDMGLAGLRKAKLSYHPHLLLHFNIVEIKN